MVTKTSTANVGLIVTKYQLNLIIKKASKVLA